MTLKTLSLVAAGLLTLGSVAASSFAGNVPAAQSAQPAKLAVGHVQVFGPFTWQAAHDKEVAWAGNGYAVRVNYHLLPRDTAHVEVALPKGSEFPK